MSERPLRARWRSLALEHDVELGPFARLAACVYAEHSTDERGNLRYSPSSSTLAERMGCSERTARKARSEVVEAGFLALEHHIGETADVRLTFPDTPARATGVPRHEPRHEPRHDVPARQRDSKTKKPSPTARKRAQEEMPARALTARGQENRAKALVDGYAGRLKAEGGSRPSRLIGQVAKRVDELVDDGVPDEAIAGALELLIERRLNPSALASLVTEAELGPRGSGDDDEAWEDLDAYDRA